MDDAESGVRPDNAEIIRTVTRLLGDPEVTWDEIEEPLEALPGWLMMVRNLRYPAPSMDNRIVWGPVHVEYSGISHEKRLRLLEFFQPFNILVDATLDPGGMAAALDQIGIDVLPFCKDHRHDAIEEVARSACRVIEAIELQRSLLRADRQSPESSLGRAAARRLEEIDGLVEPSSAPELPEAPAASWLRRFLHRK